MVIAHCTLKLRKNVKDIEIPVRLYAPVQRDQDWSCRFEIEWPEKTRTMEIYGVDSFQALRLAMQTIGAEIYTSDHHTSGNLFAWEPDQRGYGFPVPRDLRDLLVGDDAKYL